MSPVTQQILLSGAQAYNCRLPPQAVGQTLVDISKLLNSATLATAQQLHDTTPRPQAAMIVGKLDILRDSTQTFALIMDDGQEIRCMMAEEEVETLAPLFKHRVAVSGRAVFRASGRLLRVEAESVRDAAPGDQFFAKIPQPNAPRFDLRRVLRERSHKRGVAAIIGKWPGDETDEQIDEWLAEGPARRPRSSGLRLRLGHGVRMSRRRGIRTRLECGPKRVRPIGLLPGWVAWPRFAPIKDRHLSSRFEELRDGARRRRQTAEPSVAPQRARVFPVTRS